MLRPTPIEVKATNDYKLLITFDNKEVKLFDAKYLLSLKPYLPLNNKAFFSTARTNGISIEWSDDVDICPDELYYNSTPVDK
ncbi:MAG: DUF2442 domain-containing protein [Candidatus Kapabacteria bacterium]|nr:DUF2442 domain-containing protein [Candidatus Kapabacteria bacterium]